MIARLLFVGQALDGFTFALFFGALPAWILVDVQPESNPVTSGILALGGFVGVLVVKVTAAAIAVWLDGRRSTRRPPALGLVMLAVALTGFAGAASNVAGLLVVITALRALA